MRLAYDVKKRKVGCVLLQAVMGGDPDIAKRIDNKHWLLAPTPDLKVYEISPAQVEQLVAMHNKL
jgi:hypothetical protein